MHFECQVTKEGISVSCKPSERQAKVCLGQGAKPQRRNRVEVEK